MQNQGTKVGSAYIEITGKTTDFKQKMADLRAQTQITAGGFTAAAARMDADFRRSTASVRSQVEKTDLKMKGLTSSLMNVSSALALIGGVAAGKALIDMADNFSLMRSRIRLVTQAGEDLYDIEKRLTEQAMRNRAAIEPTVALYTRLRQSRKDMSDATAQMLVDNWSKSLIISASSAQEAASSTMQFSQAVAAGVLAGQELRSVIQGNSAFAVYLAEGLGVTTGALKQMGEEGKLTTDVLVEAMKKAGDSIQHDFAKKALTVHQAMTNVETAMLRFVGLQNEGAGASAQLASWINVVAQNFTLLGNALIEAGKSAAIGLSISVLINMAKALRTLSAEMLVAGTSAKALGAAMAFLGGPWGIALGAIVAGLVSMSQQLTDMRTPAEKAADAAKGVADQIKGTDEAIARANQLRGYADDLRGVAKAADEVTLKIADLNKKMAENGRLQQVNAEQNQWAKNFELINAIAKMEADLADNTTKVFVERQGYLTVNKYGPSQLAKMKTDLADYQKQLAEGQKRYRDILMAPASVFKAPGDGPTTPTPTGAAGPSKEWLDGLSYPLEDLNRRLDEINTKVAAGAENGSRAIAQALLDYLDATDDVTTVLGKLNELQGGILSADDAKYIQGLAAALDAATLGRDAFAGLDTSKLLPDGYVAETTRADEIWATYEQRIAEATKYGLMSAIETGDWGEAFGQILTDVTRDALSRAIDVLWEALGSINWTGKDGGTGWGGFFNAVGSSFRPMSSGGAVRAGEMLRVGELGSEFFMPKTDGYIIPHGVMGKSLSAPMQVSVGDTHLHVNGLANGVTTDQLAAVLEAHTRALPAAIDARVRDRQKRGAY